MKTCSKCGKTKPLSAFSKSNRERDGLQYHCKECAKATNDAYLAANPEKRKAQTAAYRHANPDKCRASDSRWRAANPEKVQELKASWAAENKEFYRLKSHERRARMAGGKLSKGLSDRLFKLQHGKCACCGKPLGNDYHLDHIMPLALGGTNEDSNIQLLRAECNLRKQAKHPIDFMRSKGFLL